MDIPPAVRALAEDPFAHCADPPEERLRAMGMTTNDQPPLEAEEVAMAQREPLARTYVILERLGFVRVAAATVLLDQF